MSRPGELVADIEARLRPLELDLAEAWWASNTQSSPDADEHRTRAELARRELLADAATLRRDPGCPSPARRRHRTRATGSSAGSSTSCTTSSCRSRCPPTCGGRSSSSRRAWSRRSTTSAGRSAAGASTTTRSSRSCGPAAMLPSAARRGTPSKQIGPEVADRVRELARLRNEAARELGYRDHFALALATGELDEDPALRHARRRGTGNRRRRSPSGRPRSTRPWRIGSGAPPTSCGPGTSTTRSSRIPPRPARSPSTTSSRAGTSKRSPCGPTTASDSTCGRCSRCSDLYARDGKSQHAFCIDIDREGDVRVLCNIEPSERWMETMLHEFGHATYDRECDRTLPWLVRTASHPLTTEGIAMLFGRLTRDPDVAHRGGRRRPRRCRRPAPRPRRGAARRAARVRALGARDDDVRAPALRRSRRRPRHVLVGPRGAVPARPPARRPARTRLGRQDPPRRRAGVLPELPLRRALRVAARRDSRDAQPAGSSTGRKRARCSPGRCSPLGRRCAGTSSSARATGEPLCAAHLARQLAA